MFHVLIMPFVCNLRKIFFDRGMGQSQHPNVQLKTEEQEKTELKELVIQAFQMFLDAEIRTTAENFEWDRSAPLTPHAIRENVGSVFHCSDQHS